MRDWSNAPTISARMGRQGPEIEGTKAFFAGHRLTNNDGIFAGWNWDGDTLTVESDRYGLQPLYYSFDGNCVRLSPSAVALVRTGECALNEDALAAFLRLGFFLGDATAFSHIRAIPSGAKMSWREGSLSVSGARPVVPAREEAERSAIDAYRCLFEQSIRRRLTAEAVALPVSGGRDSRHILLELVKSGHSPQVGLTMRHILRHDEDARIAAMLCKRANVQHVIIDGVKDIAEAESAKNLMTDMLCDEHAWGIPLADYIDNHRFPVIYDGIGGDILSAGLFLSPELVALYESNKLEELGLALLKQWSGGELWIRTVLPPAWYKRLSLDRALEAVIRELKSVSCYASPLSMFYFWNRTRREVALFTLGMMPSRTTIYCPYLDRDLFDYLASLPVSLTITKSFHQKTIAEAYPEFADIPYENPVAKIANLGEKNRRIAWALLKRTLQSIRSEMVNITVLLRNGIRGAVTGRSEYLWCDPARTLYLLQLEKLSSRY
jgi:hypothetical protein